MANPNPNPNPAPASTAHEITSPTSEENSIDDQEFVKELKSVQSDGNSIGNQ